MSSSPNRKPIIIVQGAQWGSEGKGMVAAALCERRKVKFAVRTGTVNAGHTVYHKGVAYKMQQLPTGWTSGCTLVLGPGAYIHPDILGAEIDAITKAGYSWNVYVLVDHRAGLHLPEHTDRAKLSNRHYKIGATGKGCSEAIVDRIKLRGNGGMLFKDWVSAQWQQPWMSQIVFVDTAAILNRAYDAGEQILLEGTQGTLLDLYLGPYPYTTHKQCTASQWVTEAGLSPGLDYEIVLCARTYPIRVAGNSGPMANEISWPTLAREINDKLTAAGYDTLVKDDAIACFVEQYNKLGEYPYVTPEVEASERNRDTWQRLPQPVQLELAKLFEFTTVTKKLRRVARLNVEDLKYSVMLNRPNYMCLTFLNYQFPELWGMKNGLPHTGNSGFEASLYMGHLSNEIGCPILACTTGPETCHYISR
jgi:adenylosuccinate synthase